MIVCVCVHTAKLQVDYKSSIRQHTDAKYYLLCLECVACSLLLVHGRRKLQQWFVEGIAVGHVLVEDAEYLVVEQLVHTNTLNHLLQRLDCGGRERGRGGRERGGGGREKRGRRENAYSDMVYKEIQLVQLGGETACSCVMDTFSSEIFQVKCFKTCILRFITTTQSRLTGQET